MLAKITKIMTHKFSKINPEGDLIIGKGSKETKSKKSVPAEYFNLGTYLLVPLLLAVFLGPYLDKKFQTGNLFTLILLVFGTMSVF